MAEIVKKEYPLITAKIGTLPQSEEKSAIVQNALNPIFVRKILKLSLKLAFSGVYNEKMNLVINGSEIKNTNLLKYLISAVTEENSPILWPTSLVTILRRSNILPSDVLHKSLKKLLKSNHKKRSIIIDSRPPPSYSFPVTFPNIYAEPIDEIATHESDAGIVKKSRNPRKRKLVENLYDNIRFSDRIADKKKKFDGQNGNSYFSSSKWCRISE
ncbi:uncharacterized protein LOC128390056 [Panonychus citri]|uniref:uncharacterized protein LOC128390056 n=1 Tax=Panonychus citri TaxID=50023 RepID=UPI002306F406|nr:uncharacterized protein LOC128390056 [Panonychus citri]